MHKNKLLIIDGNNLLYRSFYAYPHMSSPDGKPTNAVYGTLVAIEKALRRIQPTHLIVCLDASETTFRNLLYSEYKANRSEAPENIVPQFELIRTMLDALNIPYIEDETVEADDLIGTIATRAAGFETKIMSSDKDLLQLVNHRVNVLQLKNGGQWKEISSENFFEEFGCQPCQVPDLKAISGDSSDNIPGVPGVGEVTAKKLISKYSNIDKVLNDATNIKGKLGEKLTAATDNVRLFKALATIKTDCEIALTSDLKVNINKIKGELALQGLGIRSINFQRSYAQNTVLEDASENIEVAATLFKDETPEKPVAEKK